LQIDELIDISTSAPVAAAPVINPSAQEVWHQITIGEAALATI